VARTEATYIRPGSGWQGWIRYLDQVAGRQWHAALITLKAWNPAELVYWLEAWR
jgi:hypothetical protein